MPFFFPPAPPRPFAPAKIENGVARERATRSRGGGFHATKKTIPNDRRAFISVSNAFVYVYVSRLATHDPPSGMITRAADAGTFRGFEPSFCGGRATRGPRGGHSSRMVPSTRASPFTSLGSTKSSSVLRHASSSLSSSSAEFFPRPALESVPERPRVFPVSERSSLSESL